MSGPIRVIQLHSGTARGGARTGKPKLNREGALQATRQRKSKQLASVPPAVTGLDAVLAITTPTTPTPAVPLTSATDLRAQAQRQKFQLALQSRRKEPSAAASVHANQPIRRRVTRRRYRLGREWQRSSNGKTQLVIHVYIPSASQQQQAHQQWTTWYQSPLSDIHAFLIKRNLVPYGTHPPEHMLRTLYMSVRMLGDVYNENIQVKWHNYIHT